MDRLCSGGPNNVRVRSDLDCQVDEGRNCRDRANQLADISEVLERHFRRLTDGRSAARRPWTTMPRPTAARRVHPEPRGRRLEGPASHAAAAGQLQRVVGRRAALVPGRMILGEGRVIGRPGNRNAVDDGAMRVNDHREAPTWMWME